MFDVFVRKTVFEIRLYSAVPLLSFIIARVAFSLCQNYCFSHKSVNFTNNQKIQQGFQFLESCNSDLWEQLFKLSDTKVIRENERTAGVFSQICAKNNNLNWVGR